HGIALADQLARHGVEDLVEHRIADRPGAGVLEQWQGEPFAQYRQMAAAKDLQRHVLHGIDVLLDQYWIVVGAGAIGARHHDHKLLAHRGTSSSSRATRSGAEMMQLCPASMGR